ncbi:conserved hypothetical protein [Talaromyces stipitatus ATCC 10500]|uniref:Uncharacterized protein n=1 Tax=Talaromyces stipitatus (strain ATCC 10500 / CBS 375.48 / QM 6759 / NRRL 1006) TaxID=441959 RepID=B8MP86_TALSN|nr:uncharacterized protein TSTA_105370 [Talaromyces stipitatus ATCC 10500]EED14325.1 conserved hypothetical protein [Talaromyces stipitatus ATCC 10500]
MSGQFIYPPPNSQDVTLNYNYRDSVDVSFQTTAQDPNNTFLSLWYYLDGQPWAIGYNTSVPPNGTITVDLNILDQPYYGQFNYDFDGHKVAYLSCFFNVAHNTTQNPVTWGQSAAAAYSSSLAAATSTITTTTSTTTTSAASKGTSTSTSTRSATTVGSLGSAASVISSPSSTPSSSGLSGGAIAGIVVGVVIGVLAVLGMGLFFWRRNRNGNKSAEILASGSQHSPLPQQQELDNNQVEKPLGSVSMYSHHGGLPRYAELAGNNGLQELPG